jgi:hypothetical protein
MKSRYWVIVLAMGMVTASAALSFAKDEEAQKTEKAEKTEKAITLKGEIVDTGCYLGHEAKGADHKSCALQCIAGGMPMGLLTADGTVYLMTMSHASADPYNKAKEMASLMVEVTGPVHERGGMKAIEVTAVAEVKPAAK